MSAPQEPDRVVQTNTHTPSGESDLTTTGATPADSRIQEWKQGWPVVFASTLCLTISVVHLYAFGVFTLPLQQEFGWSKGQLASGLTVVSVISVIAAPVVGMLIDRFGPRSIAWPGMILYGVAFLSLALENGSLWGWWGAWTLVAIGTIFIKPTTWTAAITARFHTNRGLALGVSLCGLGFSAALAPVTAEVLISHLGWRGAYAVFGCVAFLTIPAILLSIPRGKSATVRLAGRKGSSTVEGATIRQALGARDFWLLTVSGFAFSTALMGLIVEYVPILRWAELSATRAASAAGIVGLASILGRLGSGYALDRTDGRFIGAIVFSSPAIACLTLAFIKVDLLTGAAAAAIFGVALGAEIDLICYLTANYFGLRNFGILFGTMMGMVGLGAGLGPLVSGSLFDATRSFFPVLVAATPVFILSGALMLCLNKPHRSTRKAL